MSIYKACDIRGTYGEDLTSDVALNIARAVGFKMAGRRIVVGGDVRLSTPILKEAIISGLVDSGCHVIDIGVVPTPAFYFGKRHLNAEGGIMVTASHNPPQFNGLKLILGDLPITPEEIEEIRRLAEEKRFLKAKGDGQRIEITDAYKESIKKMFNPGKRYKAVVDASNGCYSEIAPCVMRQLGYDVKEICCKMDGRFPSHLPNPAVKDNLRQLSEEVKRINADVGIGFDCDGDRVVFVDEMGRIIETDKGIVIIAKYLLKKKNGGKIVYDLKCSGIVPEEVSKAGGIPIMEKSGHAFIKKRVIEEKAIMGGEISGHFFYDFFDGGDDGLYSSLLMLKIMSESRKKLSTLVSNVPSYYNTPDIRVPYEESDKLEVLEKIKDALSSYEISTLDGVRVIFPQGWGLVRLSISEPLLTFRFEAKTAEELPLVMEKFLAPVPHVREIVYKNYNKPGGRNA